ncbi:MAG: bifunctional adenosylcobinamide kinase/adenosylcobinamide-phosphate guanylyltransferase [Methylocystis sp.]|nr:bifunctional adenosylcobinamide kinase/adenosylcobinamide-phosphate guanylyltransferase [Methylocystis sp.]MCA3583983.1 bifunctional adenosylcobinamide kinase/adenosylcobinamide-phosphate guanylyltransferase [Methylocystis sp.]MCA3588914.1 bifunctional adenosylcobinamide kinase/adenosylcobinamide-phosphate guanylyltransferase [Methylocystis sp.]MCA3592522.1 bifunctional adenosylcobinamide kinase/adenosylcobinamide-phosphate guanylyltransferase [Methylocystis sp.]
MSGPSSVLVLGGARSGKSAHAEKLARETGLSRVYLATAQAFDDEMRERIQRHQADRADQGWRTVEEPLALAAAIERHSKPDTVLLVDCLTLWLTNVMLAGEDVAVMSDALLGAVAAASGPVILVSNEVGMGIVPESSLGRAFRDAQGRLNQAAARAVPHVVLIAAGLPLTLKAP